MMKKRHRIDPIDEISSQILMKTVDGALEEK